MTPALRDAILAAVKAGCARIEADVMALIATPPVPEPPKEVLGPHTQAAIRAILAEAGPLDRELSRTLYERAHKLTTLDGWADDAVAHDLMSGYQE